MSNVIKFKRGLESARTFTPASGEPVWTTDAKNLYVGDGTTVGGVSVTKSITDKLGAVSGIATLDANGKVPLTQINDALLGNVKYQGTWNANTNTPTLPAATNNKGNYWVTSVSGTYNSISFVVGDWVISNGTAYEKVDNTDAVSSVFGRTGVVTAQSGDYTTTQVTEGNNLYYTNNRVSDYLVGGISNILTSNLTASRVCITDTNGKITSTSTVTPTHLNYLVNVTSDIQSQLNNKQDAHSNLYSISSLTYASAAFVKMTGANTFSLDTNTYLTQSTFNSGNADLAAIEALSGTSGLLKKTDANTWELDTRIQPGDINGNVAVGGTYTFSSIQNSFFGNGITTDGSTSRNTLVGSIIGNSSFRGILNTFIGYQHFTSATGASCNISIGASNGLNITTGQDNILIGEEIGNALTLSAYSNIFIGGGRQLAGNIHNRLIIDPIYDIRTNDTTDALIYGVADSNPAYQTLSLNATVNARYGLNVNGANVVTESTKTREIVIQMEGISNSAPSVVNFVDANNSCLAFNGNATTNNLYGSIYLDHDYLAGTDLILHLHWTPTTAAGGNVKWQVYYSWCESGGAWTAGTLITATTATDSTAWADKLSTFTISGTGHTFNSRLKLRLFRNPGDAADTYSDNAAYVQLGCHYSANLGQAG